MLRRLLRLSPTRGVVAKVWPVVAVVGCGTSIDLGYQEHGTGSKDAQDVAVGSPDGSGQDTGKEGGSEDVGPDVITDAGIDRQMEGGQQEPPWKLYGSWFQNAASKSFLDLLVVYRGKENASGDTIVGAFHGLGTCGENNEGFACGWDEFDGTYTMTRRDHNTGTLELKMGGTEGRNLETHLYEYERSDQYQFRAVHVPALWYSELVMVQHEGETWCNYRNPSLCAQQNRQPRCPGSTWYCDRLADIDICMEDTSQSCPDCETAGGQCVAGDTPCPAQTEDLSFSLSGWACRDLTHCCAPFSLSACGKAGGWCVEFVDPICPPGMTRQPDHPRLCLESLNDCCLPDGGQ